MDNLDIINLVADFLSEKERARLALTSKLFFTLVMPMAWRTVLGATQLFKLLPGMKVELPRGAIGTETLYLPPKLQCVSFERFRYYANFVKHLYLFKSPTIVHQINKWSDLLDYTSRNTLLPSLVSITLNTYWPESVSHFAWIAVFCSPSVRHIEAQTLVRKNIPMVPNQTTSGILKILINRCPNLEFLSIFVDPKLRPSPLEPGLLKDESECVALFFDSNKSIRNLACTSAMAGHCHKTLSLSSRLPQLRSLQMYSTGQGEDIAPDIPLGTGGFPALAELHLFDFLPSATLSIWTSVSALARLTHVELEIDHSTQDQDQDIHAFYNTKLIPAICTRAPNITDLSIRPITDGDSYLQIDITTLELLSALPLQSLTCARSCIGHQSGEPPAAVLAPLFPMIKILRWPDLTITYTELHQLASMQHLKHLSVGLDFESFSDSSPLDSAKAIPQDHLWKLRVLESDFSKIDLLSPAEVRIFLSRIKELWPHLIDFRQNLPFDYPQCDGAANERVSALNEMFKEIPSNFQPSI